MYKIILLNLLFLVNLVMTATPAKSFPLQVGVGQETWNIKPYKVIDQKTGTEIKKNKMLSRADAEVYAEKAVRQALADYGQGSPKLVILFDRSNFDQETKKGLEKALAGKNIPYIIDGSWTPTYSAIGRDCFANTEQQSLLAFALGGDIDIQTGMINNVTMPVKDWELKKKFGDQEEKVRKQEQKKHQDWGKELAKQFDTSKPGTKIFIQLGTQHVPRHIWLLEGVSKIFPKDVHVIGGAQADFAWQVHNGKKYENTVYGILITGDFKVVQGILNLDDVENNDQAIGIKQLITDLKSELGSTPEIAFYFGCAGWNKKNEEQKQVYLELLPDTSLIGRFNGGEIGRIKTDGKNYAKANLASIMLIGEMDSETK